MRTKLASLVLLSLCSKLAAAGGSWEPASVASFKLTSETDYVLVIELVRNNSIQEQSQDPMFLGCTRLEVHGTFGALRAKGRFAWFQDVFAPPKHNGLTRAKHAEAIGYLKSAAIEHRVINFGYVGTGFVPIETEYPCVVASRSLELYEQRGSTAIVSYHNDF